MTEEEFRNIVMPHHRAMAGIASTILGNREDVRDCLQEALVSLWTQRHRLKEIENVEGYCIRTIRNTALSMLRRQRCLDDAIPEIAERMNPETMLENKDRLAKVMDGIESLPDVQKQVVKLSTIEDLPPDDVAERQGISPVYVRQILSRARKRLRNILKEK